MLLSDEGCLMSSAASPPLTEEHEEAGLHMSQHGEVGYGSSERRS
jgi:hypothetical protein